MGQKVRIPAEKLRKAENTMFKLIQKSAKKSCGQQQDTSKTLSVHYQYAIRSDSIDNVLTASFGRCNTLSDRIAY